MEGFEKNLCGVEDHPNWQRMRRGRCGRSSGPAKGGVGGGTSLRAAEGGVGGGRSSGMAEYYKPPFAGSEHAQNLNLMLFGHTKLSITYKTNDHK